MCDSVQESLPPPKIYGELPKFRFVWLILQTAHQTWATSDSTGWMNGFSLRITYFLCGSVSSLPPNVGFQKFTIEIFVSHATESTSHLSNKQACRQWFYQNLDVGSLDWYKVFSQLFEIISFMKSSYFVRSSTCIYFSLWKKQYESTSVRKCTQKSNYDKNIFTTEWSGRDFLSILSSALVSDKQGVQFQLHN